MEVIIGDGEKKVTLLNPKTSESVTIDVARGGATESLLLLHPRHQDKDDSNKSNLISVLKTAGERYPGSMLIPWPNRIRDGKYTFCHRRTVTASDGTKSVETKEKSYVVPINEPAPSSTALHGLTENVSFGIKHFSSDERKALVVLSCRFLSDSGAEGIGTVENPEGYPFDVRVEIKYILFNSCKRESTGAPEEQEEIEEKKEEEEGKGLKIEVSATNLDLGEEGWDVPFAVGWHPYWWFGDEQESLDEWRLTLPGGKQIEVDNRLIPTGKTIDFAGFNSELLAGHKYDTGWLFDGTKKNKKEKEGKNKEKSKDEQKKKEEVYKVILENQKKQIKEVIWQDKVKYDYFQIYTPNNRKSIAMEPMSAATNSFNDEGHHTASSSKIRLLADTTWVGAFGVYLQ